MSTQEYRHIVRIVGNDIPGAKKAIVGLTQIKGIGYNFATAILDTLKINTNTNIGFLSEANVESIEKLITNPIAGNFPAWFLNRRKDIETGANMHLLTSDIPFTLRNDIERERITNSWRGYRHMYGLKVRGQCTRTTGRKGGAVGVAKAGKAAPAAAAAAAPAAAAAAAPAAGATATAKPAAAKPSEEKKAAPAEKKK
ncbi:30S ribosomal protein S13 [Nitrosarchaeum koreense]|uniref:30S ribosomal protein S13 n=1 Tax=Nitrosarchaeum koreense TaxID=1088740 RepID=UPI00064FA985|nr:30S ribosomal protein S13 [Nitrosarchaeum koreense]